MITTSGKLVSLCILLACCAGAGCGGIGTPPGNLAPVVLADIVPNPVTVGSSATLVAAAFDPNPADTLTYQWAQVGGEALTITNATAANATVTPTQIGSYSFQVTVSDGLLSAVSDPVTLTAVEEDGGEPPAANEAPDIVASLNPSAGFPDTRVDMQASADDPEDDPVWFLWSQVSGPSVSIQFANSPNAYFFSPQVSELTELVFRITAGDNRGAEDHLDLTYQASPAPFVSALHSPSNDPVYPGEMFYFLITIKNESSSEQLTGVHVVASPPTDDLELISTTGGGVISGGQITWDIPSISPLQTPGVSYTVRVRPDVTGLPRHISSTASVTTNEFIGQISATAVVQIIE